MPRIPPNPRRLVRVAAAATCVLALFASPAFANRAADFPDPGGDESAAVDLGSIAPKLVGANDDFQSWVYPHETSIGKLSGAGMSAVRRTLSWASLEPLPGVWDNGQWREAASYYQTALDHGMEPVFILAFAPSWAWSPEDLLACPSGKCAMPPGTLADSAWQRFTAEAASRFPEATFDIWNEPNTREFWASGPDPARWAELVRIAADAINSRSGNARVIVGGLAGITAHSSATIGESGGLTAAEFLRRALAAPAAIGGRFDAVSLHFFPQSYWPFIPFDFGVGTHLAELLKGVRGALADAGLEGTKLWFDEVGFWTSDPGAPQYAVSEEHAATGLTKLIRRLITMDDVEAVIVHRAIDAALPAGANRFQVRNSTFGLMRRNTGLEPKPAYCAIASMYAAASRATACEAWQPAPLPQPAPQPAPEPAPAPTPALEPSPAPDPAADPADTSSPAVVSVRRLSRARIRINASDQGEGLAALQIAFGKRNQAERWRSWSGPRMTIQLGRRTARQLHVRVQDSAGNLSRWATRTLTPLRPSQARARRAT